MEELLSGKRAVVVGGPIPIPLDAVSKIVPAGSGYLAQQIADEAENHFSEVVRYGSFKEAQPVTLEDLLHLSDHLTDGDVVIFLPHIPNVYPATDLTKKLRVSPSECTVDVSFFPTPKIVSEIKDDRPSVLLVPFKIARAEQTKIDIVKWMLEIRSSLAVYSRLGHSEPLWIIDALGNEQQVSREELPAALLEKVKKYASATRRRSNRTSSPVMKPPFISELVKFSNEMQPAFKKIIEGNVEVDRWPGNFSFRCTYGFLSHRFHDSFFITRRNVAKTGLTEDDFVLVSQVLEDGELVYSGPEGMKPSIDAPIHRVLYEDLSWVSGIIHGHLLVSPEHKEYVFPKTVDGWPCGAEDEGVEIVRLLKEEGSFVKAPVVVVNLPGHGFVALLSRGFEKNGLEIVSSLKFLSSNEYKEAYPK